jgi:hypothetical protein
MVGALKGVHKAGRLESRCQGLELTRAHRRIDDVLAGGARESADRQTGHSQNDAGRRPNAPKANLHLWLLCFDVCDHRADTRSWLVTILAGSAGDG